jgi:hypothetical protein
MQLLDLSDKGIHLHYSIPPTKKPLQTFNLEKKEIFAEKKSPAKILY